MNEISTPLDTNLRIILLVFSLCLAPITDKVRQQDSIDNSKDHNLVKYLDKVIGDRESPYAAIKILRIKS